MDYSNERNENMTYVSINLAEYFEKLGEIDWFIFETIVAKGISEEKDAKCDKMARLTKHLIFVGQNRKIVCGVLKRQLESWIERRGRINLLQKGIRVYLTTMSDLDSNKWTYIYDMTTDEPISCIRGNKNLKETENYES